MLLAKKSILFIYGSVYDPYKTHRSSVVNFATEFLKQGYKPIFVDICAKGGVELIVSLVQDRNIAAVYCEQGWGLDIPVNNGGMLRNLYELLAKPVFAHIREYPYYPWLVPKITNDCYNWHVFHAEQSCVDLAHKMANLKGHHDVMRIVAQVTGYDYDAAHKPLKDRPIDFLYVGSYKNPMKIRDEFATKSGDMLKVFDAIVDENVMDEYVPSWRATEKILPQYGYEFNPADSKIQFLLFMTMKFICQYRRKLMFSKLVKYPLYLVMAHEKPDVKFHPDTVIKPPMNFPETMKLYEQAKSLIVCQPHFPNSVSERTPSAMYRGTAVITNTNTTVEEFFTPNKNILDLNHDYSNLGEKMEMVKDYAFAQEMVENARDFVSKEMSPEKATRKIMKTMGLKPLL